MNKTLLLDNADFEKDYKKGMDFAEECAVYLDAKKHNSFLLAFEEAFVNILKYNGDKSDLRVEISVEYKGGTLKAAIKDNGVRFNPLERDEPNLTLSAEERDIGGLGILLIKKLTDFSAYDYINGCNVLTLGVNSTQEAIKL